MSTDAKKTDPTLASRGARLAAALGDVGKEDRHGKIRKVPTLNEFAEDLLQEVGGSRNLARMFVAEMRSAQGQNKQRLLDTFTRVITAAAKMEGQSLGDTEELSDDDLQAEFSSEVGRLLESQDGEEEADEGPAE